MIKQGYTSTSIASFDFVNKFKLSSSVNYNEPIIIFGLYNKFDFKILKKFKSHITIFWAGIDSLQCPLSIIEYIKSLSYIRHITCLLPVQQKLMEFDITCELIGVWKKNNCKFKAVIKGDKIYSYIPSISKRGHNIDRNYFGYDIIKSLNIEDQLLIGGTDIDMNVWCDGVGINTYSKCYIGLGLSRYAGGGASIIEMGLCGIKVITNLIDAPHVIKWETRQDIINIIDNERKNIGKIDINLAASVYDSLSTDEEWLIIQSS